MHPIESARDALAFYREFCSTAPDELTPYALIVTAPPAPFVPPDLVGRQVVVLAGCYAGDIADGEKALAPLREFESPPIDLFQPLPYAALQSMFDETGPAGHSYYLKGDYVSELTDELISTLIEHAEAFPGPHCEVHFGQMGGAVGRIDENDTAFSGRDAGFVFIGLAHWLERHEEEAQLAWVQGLSDAVRPNSVGTSVNFLGDEGEERIRFAYGSGEKYDQLVELKRAWDPQNLFRLNQNIRP